ncbi:hypothetical protein Syun_007649 [Stephania yunnanensis]|uniref:Pentatricopeptide repeat-containing protein n=1 Tax=Stephania yunnanensis TaxID=152371 RepID=A0AAP0KYW3_9MAGN
MDSDARAKASPTEHPQVTESDAGGPSDRPAPPPSPLPRSRLLQLGFPPTLLLPHLPHLQIPPQIPLNLPPIQLHPRPSQPRQIPPNPPPSLPLPIPHRFIHHRQAHSLRAFDLQSTPPNGSPNCPQTCNSLLSALASDDHLGHARKVFEEMLLREIPFTSIGFGVFVGKLCRGVELEATLSLLDEVIQRGGDSLVNGSIVALLVVDGLCRVSRVCEASTLLDDLRSRGYKPDFIAYRVVAEGFRLGGRVLEAEKVLKRKRKYGVAPRASDYREFLFGLISERRSWEAKELGEVIIGGNFPIEDDVLNALIGSVSAIDPDSATAFCRYMIEKGRSPTILTLTNLSKSLCKNGKVDELLEIFMLLSSKDYFSDVESYTMMVSYLCTAGLVKEAYRFLKEMKRKGFVPDVSLYNALMEACCREDLLRPAKRLWDEMFASGCQGNLKTYNTLIRKLSESGEAEDANRLFRRMLEKGLVPDSTTYVSLLEGLCQETKIQAACEIFNECIQQDILLAKTVLTALVLSLCKEGHLLAASKVIQGLIPESGNASCHVFLLRCFVEAGEFQMAIEHMKWIKDTAPSISQVLSSELVASLSYSLKPEPILQLLRLLKENDMVPDNDTWMDLWNGSSFVSI